MRKTIYGLLTGLLCLTAAACTEDSDIFYTTTRHITRVEAKVTLADSKPEPEPQPEPGPKPEPSAAEGESQGDNPLVAQIREELLAKSPAVEGDTYTFSFMVYNAGILLLQSGEQTTEGRFTKVPGSDEIGFLFGEEYHIAQVTSPVDEQTPGELYTFDFTKEYQQLYPDAKIVEAKRLEYVE